LYLQITPKGVKSWLYRYEFRGRERGMGLGPYHTISLPEARERARAARQLLLDGIDPLDARKEAHAAAALAAAKMITFEKAARQYFDERARGWKNAKHRAQFLSSLATYAFPKIGAVKVSDIDTGLVRQVIEPPWLDKVNPRVETANRVRARIEAILDWATVRGYRSGNNPARWKGHLAHSLPAPGKVAKTQHHPALPYAELPAFMTALAERPGIAARALEFTILTAARTGEVIGATADEFDFKERVWTVPAGRIKGGREHRVPLSAPAVALLRALPREAGNRFVFVGAKPGTRLSDMAMGTVLQRMKIRFTTHGFRSTFRDWAAERTSFANHVVEMALAHAIGNKVEAAYRRGDLFDKRRKLMEAWGTYCMSSPEASGEVVPLRGAQR
jgi:integrase